MKIHEDTQYEINVNSKGSPNLFLEDFQDLKNIFPKWVNIYLMSHDTTK